MKMHRFFGIFALALLTATAACERDQRLIGGDEHVRGYLGAPQASAESEPQVSLPPGAAYVAAVMPVGEAEVELDPATLYAQNCAACHQQAGQGIPGVFPPLDGSEYVTADSRLMASIMLYGMQGPIEVKGTRYANVMAGLGGTLNDEQLAAIATFVRSSWSNGADAVEPTVFAEMRQKWGGRGPFTIEELLQELSITLQ